MATLKDTIRKQQMGHKVSYDASNYNSATTANGGGAAGYDPATVQSGAISA